MGRPRRVCLPSCIYHVTSRGDNREVVFPDAIDHQRYLQLLNVYKRKWRFDLFCYALMPNHVHLLLRTLTSEGSVSKILHDMQFRYAQHMHQRYQRVGHVFQGRFHASLVEKERYLLAASRYIHLNPVRAGLCQTSSEYPWTSVHAYLDPTGNPLQLVDTDLILSMCAIDPARQRHAYQQLVETDWCQAPKHENFAKEIMK